MTSDKEDKLKKLINDIALGQVIDIAYEDDRHFVGLVIGKDLDEVVLTNGFSFKGNAATLRTLSKENNNHIPYAAISNLEVLKSYLD